MSTQAEKAAAVPRGCTGGNDAAADAERVGRGLREAVRIARIPGHCDDELRTRVDARSARRWRHPRRSPRTRRRALAAAIDIPRERRLRERVRRRSRGGGGERRARGRDGPRRLLGRGLHARRRRAAVYDAGARRRTRRRRGGGRARGAVALRADRPGRELIHGHPDLADTIARLQAYQEAGADVLFAPGIQTADDIRSVVESVDLPVNVLVLPGRADRRRARRDRRRSDLRRWRVRGRRRWAQSSRRPASCSTTAPTGTSRRRQRGRIAMRAAFTRD